MTGDRTFHEDTYWPQIQTNGETAIADTTYYPASASFIDVSGFERVVFLIEMGATDSTITFQVRQDTSATVTGSVKALAGAVQVITGTQDSQQFSIEFSPRAMDAANNFKFVSLYATGAGGANDFAKLTCLLYRPRTLPVTQLANYPAANQAVVY